MLSRLCLHSAIVIKLLISKCEISQTPFSALCLQSLIPGNDTQDILKVHTENYLYESLDSIFPHNPHIIPT